MKMPFIRSIRTIEVDRRFRSPVSFLTACVLIVGWLGWLLFASLGVWESSSLARVEVEGEASSIESSVSGVVLNNHLSLGKIVRKGDVLLELDAGEQSVEWKALVESLEYEKERLKNLKPIQKLEVEAALERIQLREAELQEALALEANAEAELNASARVKKRQEELNRQGVVPLSELESYKVQFERKAGALEASKARRAQSESSLKTAKQELSLLKEEGRGAEAELEASIRRLETELEQLNQDRQRRTILAQSDGQIGDMAPLKPGQFIREGTRICTIVPKGTPRVVAWFEPQSAGSLRLDQPAILELVGPKSLERMRWPARVVGVASELREGKVRVELDITEGADSEDLSHGRMAIVEVEIATIKPLQWLGLTALKHVRG